MTIAPDVGDTVYVPGFDQTGPVTEYVGDWALVQLDGATAAKRADELVVPSKHGKMRWRTRMWDPGEGQPDESREMAERWADGVVLEKHGMYGDEVRLDPDSGAVMVRSENAIATVVDPGGRKAELARAVARVKQ